MLGLISNRSRESQPQPIPVRHHAMLAGLSQKSFLKQWGEPEIQISLDPLEGFFSGDSVVLSADAPEEVSYSVWIYEKQDRIFFFKRQRLASHFKWSQFREKLKKPKEYTPPHHFKRPSPLMTTTLALVA